MKKIEIRQLFATSSAVLSVVATLSLVSCANFRQGPISSDGLNPLNPAGSFQEVAPEVKLKKGYSHFSPGSFLTTQSSNAAFYTKYPSGTQQPEKTLANGTEVKVISSKLAYTKVELVNTGEVGYVSTVLLGQDVSFNDIAGADYQSTFDTPNPAVQAAPITPVAPLAPELLPEGVAPSISASDVPFSVIDDLPSVAPPPQNTGLYAPVDVSDLPASQ